MRSLCLAFPMFAIVAACAHSDPSRRNDPSFQTYATQDFTYGTVRPAGSAAREFTIEVLPPFGATLVEARSPGFMVSGVAAGEALFGANTISGLSVYCTVKEVRLGGSRTCFIDGDSDSAFETACFGDASQVVGVTAGSTAPMVRTAAAFPAGFPLGVSVITTCAEQTPALRYIALEKEALPRGAYRFWFEPSRSGGITGRAAFILADGGTSAWGIAEVSVPQDGEPAPVELGGFVFLATRSGDAVTATLTSMPDQTRTF